MTVFFRNCFLCRQNTKQKSYKERTLLIWEAIPFLIEKNYTVTRDVTFLFSIKFLQIHHNVCVCVSILIASIIYRAKH